MAIYIICAIMSCKRYIILVYKYTTCFTIPANHVDKKWMIFWAATAVMDNKSLDKYLFEQQIMRSGKTMSALSIVQSNPGGNFNYVYHHYYLHNSMSNFAQWTIINNMMNKITTDTWNMISISRFSHLLE